MNEAIETAFTSKLQSRASALVYVADQSEAVLPEALLFDAGYSVHLERGKKRLPSSNEHPFPDVMLWQLPELDDLALEEIRRFKSEPATQNVGLLIVLQDGGMVESMRAVEWGADDCFFMPLNERLVLLRLSYLTQTSESYDVNDAQGTKVGFFFFDFNKGSYQFNGKICELFDIEPDDLDADPRCLWEGVHADDFERVTRLMHAAPKVDFDQIIEFRLAQPDAEGRDVFLETALVNIVDLGVIFGMIRDVSVSRRDDGRLLQQVYFDALTQLPNRRLLEQYLEENLPLLHASGRDLTVLLVDLDLFSRINNVYGQKIGDLVLQTVAERLMGIMPLENEDLAFLQTQIIKNRGRHLNWNGALLARISADGFVMCLPAYSAEEREVDKLQEVLDDMTSKPFHFDQQEVFLTASVGMAVSDLRSLDPDILLQRVDLAMHEAKREGRNRICQFEGHAIDSAAAQMAMHNDMRRALIGNEFRLQYQPKIDPRTGELMGVEALIRWLHPRRGNVSPAEFIPIAEETGLIVDIGDWVLKAACEQGMQWLKADGKGIPIAVNVSARQFKDSRLVDRILGILSESGLPPALLELEITEGAMIHGEGTVDAIRQLQSAGIIVALDDFGTGFSSLSYLLQFPIDLLKIDRSFIQNIDEHNDKAAIVAALTQMSKTLSFRVVAEGVESQDEMQRVIELGCDQVQGYLVSRPLAPEDFMDWRRLH